VPVLTPVSTDISDEALSILRIQRFKPEGRRPDYLIRDAVSRPDLLVNQNSCCWNRGHIRKLAHTGGG